MSDPDAIAECEADIYSMGALQEKTTDAGDGLVMMTEEETYHSDSVQGSDIGQEEPPVEVDEPLELRNSQEIAVNDKQCPPAVSGDGGDSRQKTPGDTAVGEQDLAVASRQHTPSRERRVYVGNLSYQVTWRDLKDFMRKCKLSFRVR